MVPVACAIDTPCARLLRSAGVKNTAGSAHTDGANVVPDPNTGKRTRANAAGPLCDEVVVVGPRGFKGQTQLGQKKPHTR